MDRDWSKASPELAWALSAAVTVIAVIIGGVYSWHRRRNAVNTEESVQVQWPSGKQILHVHMLLHVVVSYSRSLLCSIL